VFVSILLSRGENPLDLTPTVSLHGAVAADTQLCSKAGVAVLQEGGNAIDAGTILFSLPPHRYLC
jgi:gamma-glutamyltranspeptidase